MSYITENETRVTDYKRYPNMGRRILVAGAALLTCLLSIGSSRGLAATAPLVLEKSITIPDVPLWPYSDHLAIDLAAGRLFATPQGAKAVAVIDLKTGRVLKMITGMGNPHGIFYSSTLKRLFVSEGAFGDVKVFNGNNYSLIRTIPLALGADALEYDPRSRLLFVADGQGAKTGRAFISIVDPVRMEKVADIPVVTSDFEGMGVDPEKHLLYASLPDESAVAVVDFRARRLLDTWKLPAGNHAPFAIAVDSARNRIYVACRDALHTTAMNGTLFVLDTADGHPVAELPMGGWADGISIDHKRHRIYVSNGVGYVDTFTIGAHDGYRRLQPVETALLGKTSVYSSELDRLYVSVPQVGDAPAQILVLKPSP